jgi:uncharacterized protein (DUF924 family)
MKASPTSINPDAYEALQFWFGDLDQTPAWYHQRMRLWFMGGTQIDDEIRNRFGNLVNRAARSELESWLHTPKEALALILLLDQFALNIYRNEARGYHCSEAAIPISKKILSLGWDTSFTPAEKIFAYMPLEHSESLEDQLESVNRFQLLSIEARDDLKEIMNGYLSYAKRHLVVVERFGRFPHRNEALKRATSENEKTFLASSDAPF